ncbi:hypothetical protein DENSPDRAFT_227133 [Dentipellis sp. KUC8613]|nr:hypothetical protein DENSPDRAFT_227133 [Dentipellis sp. KUC8613]
MRANVSAEKHSRTADAGCSRLVVGVPSRLQSCVPSIAAGRSELAPRKNEGVGRCFAPMNLRSGKGPCVLVFFLTSSLAVCCRYCLSTRLAWHVQHDSERVPR